LNLSRHNRGLAGALALVALLAAACVKQENPGVAIKSLKSQIVFGLAPPAATPPGITPLFDDGFDITEPRVPNLPKLPVPKPALPCREATATDSPEKLKTNGVTDAQGKIITPELGVYKWRANGELDYGTPTKIPIKNQPLERRVTGLTPVEETEIPVGGATPTDPIKTSTFSYDVVTDLGGGITTGIRRVDTYQVKNNPIAVVAGTSTANIGRGVTVGDPERGVSLKKSSVTVAGQPQYTFQPATGLLLLPLSVNAGEQYQSVAVDPLNGAVVVLDAVVGGQQKDYVDACGDLVDGWRVTARQTFLPPNAAAVVTQYEYVVATQLGGILVYEKVGPPDLNAIPIPTPPVIPGAPTPNIPSPPTSLPAIPVPLPTLDHTEELILSSLHPVR
jgi:hypothetical protein